MPNYDVGTILYGNCMNAAGPHTATEWARAYDGTFPLIVSGQEAYEDADANGSISAGQLAAFVAQVLVYFDMWGSSSYSGGLWHFGPGDTECGEEPDVVMNSTVHCFRMTDRHMQRLAGFVEAALTDETIVVGGAFMDDYGHDKRSWLGPAGEAHNHANTIANMRKIWAPHNGRDGWETGSESDWNQPRVAMLTRLLLRVSRGTNKPILFNGSSASLGADQPRMWEGYQRNYTRAYVQANCKPGDWLVVNARDYDDPMGTPTLAWYELDATDLEVTKCGRTAGETYEAIMEDAAEDAVSYGLRVAVSGAKGVNSNYLTTTVNGDTHHSVYSILEDPDNWPDG